MAATSARIAAFLLVVATALPIPASATPASGADGAPPPRDTTPLRPGDDGGSGNTSPAAPGAESDSASPTAPKEKEPRYSELFAVITTSRGEMKARLYPNEVPRMVANFVNLARHEFYDGMTFHAVARGFQVHTGDPTGTGEGDCGYTIQPQFSGRILFDQPGTLALWSTTGRPGCQFMITLRENERKLNLNQAAFGRLVSGLEVARAIRIGDRLESVRIEGDPSVLLEDFADEVRTWNEAIESHRRRSASDGAGQSETAPRAPSGE